MPSYYNILRAQLITDIRAVLGPTAVVCFGRPRREIKTYPHAVVKTRRQRPKEGPRRIGEGFEFAGNYIVGEKIDIAKMCTVHRLYTFYKITDFFELRSNWFIV